MTIAIDPGILHSQIVFPLRQYQSLKMQLVPFIVACVPLAVLASPIELVDREAAPDAWVELPGFSEKRADPKELFRRKSHQ